MIYEFNEDLQKACEEWQKILRLQDWNVKTSIYRARDMELQNVDGECSWNVKKKMAHIKLLDPTDRPHGLMEEQDMEKTLVHELLHLHYAPFDSFQVGTPEEISLEQSVDIIACSLVALKRGNR